MLTYFGEKNSIYEKNVRDTIYNNIKKRTIF